VIIFNVPQTAQTVKIHDLVESICPRIYLYINCINGDVISFANNFIAPNYIKSVLYYLQEILVAHREDKPYVSKWFKSDNFDDIINLIKDFNDNKLPTLLVKSKKLYEENNKENNKENNEYLAF